MKPPALHRAAAHLYPDCNVTERWAALARDLQTPCATVKKWWYGRTRIPGAVEVALRLMVRMYR